jgi:predicted transcriptional regulator
MGMTRLQSLQRWRKHFKESQDDNEKNLTIYSINYNSPRYNYFDGRVDATKIALIAIDSLIEMEEERNYGDC